MHKIILVHHNILPILTLNCDVMLVRAVTWKTLWILSKQYYLPPQCFCPTIILCGCQKYVGPMCTLYFYTVLLGIETVCLEVVILLNMYKCFIINMFNYHNAGLWWYLFLLYVHYLIQFGDGHWAKSQIIYCLHYNWLIPTKHLFPPFA